MVSSQMIKGWQYLWALIALIIAVTITYVLIMATREAQSQTKPPPLQSSIYDERLNAIDKEAIEEAYRQQVILLFANWMKDSTHQQPDRALVGHRIARKAYVDAMTALGQR